MAGKEKHPVITRRAPAPAVLLAALLGLLLAVAALLVGVATSAQAHDVLIGTTPADGATTAVVPARLTLSFGAPVLALGTIIIVTGPAGQVQTGKAVLTGNVVTQHLRPGSPAGRYNVVWRVSSADGHPVSGQFSFTARTSSPRQPAPATSTTPTTATATVPAVPATTATTSPPDGPGTAASRTSDASSLWWILGGGAGAVALVVVLLVRFIAARRTRTTPDGEPDPPS
ncbi:MAG TPA: copper resistance CopC family protein [Dermatophilaceae bacterium]